MTRPCISPSRARSLVEQFYAIAVEDIRDLGGYADQNFLIVAKGGQKHVFKIHDDAEPAAVIDMQIKAIEKLARSCPDLALPEALPVQSGEVWVTLEGDGTGPHLARLLKFVPGNLLAETARPSDALLRNAGTVVGALDLGLADFTHPAAARPDMVWDLQIADIACRHINLIEEPELRRLADYFFLQFETFVRNDLRTLPLSITHNDCHRYALLAEPERPDEISGVIDFGDTVLSYNICHLAIVISDLVVGRADLAEAATVIASGYHKSRPISRKEIDLIYWLVGLRLGVYLAKAALARRDEPDNAHSQLKRAEVEALIRDWIKINPVALANQIGHACGLAQVPDDDEKVRQSQLDRRSDSFSGSLYCHYRDPLVLERGAFQYLYDANGKTYLDLVNNVCQSGHCHPTIVRAQQQQAARLNTNSRYVYRQMTDYAERLLATFPDELDTVFLVNSGSEANDLAMRMARAFTGHSDMAVIESAYHGNSSACTDISPNRIDGAGKPGLPGYVHKVPVPDRYRGQFGYDDPEAGRSYANALEPIIDQLNDEGMGLAAFYAESLIGTGGQIVLPPGYLAHAYSLVRNSGGLCIADEVQVGFGRTGDHMWCHESQNVTPDIVTMGKPMANGFPMGAVVTRREIADAFDNGITYFNTFGGNPLACASALGVLDVLEGEGLQENCRSMGELLRQGLQQLAKKHSCIGDVRGLGLYLGVEIVGHTSDKLPDKRRAGELVEKMKSRGLLTNVNGYLGNVLKFKPPLLVSASDIDRIVTGLGECLV